MTIPWATILGIIGKWLLGVFTGPRSKSRIRLEVKSEAVIIDERKRLDRLAARMKGIDSELQQTVIELVAAKRRGDHPGAAELDAKRNCLMQDLRAARRQYDDAQRSADKSR